MSMNPISTRYSTALAILQPTGQGEAATAASNPTSDIIKTANGISTAPGAVAKQAAGVAFTFTASQSLRDEAQKGAGPTPIIMAGIGGGEAVERFDSWEALEARIRTDGTMDDIQKSEWLDQASSLKASVLDLKRLQQSDLYLGLKSGAFEAEINAAVNKYLAESTSAADLKASINSGPVATFLRDVAA